MCVCGALFFENEIVLNSWNFIVKFRCDSKEINVFSKCFAVMMPIGGVRWWYLTRGGGVRWLVSKVRPKCGCYCRVNMWFRATIEPFLIPHLILKWEFSNITWKNTNFNEFRWTSKHVFQIFCSTNGFEIQVEAKMLFFIYLVCRKKKLFYNFIWFNSLQRKTPLKCGECENEREKWEKSSTQQPKPSHYNYISHWIQCLSHSYFILFIFIATWTWAETTLTICWFQYNKLCYCVYSFFPLAFRRRFYSAIFSHDFHIMSTAHPSIIQSWNGSKQHSFNDVLLYFLYSRHKQTVFRIVKTHLLHKCTKDELITII